MHKFHSAALATAVTLSTLGLAAQAEEAKPPKFYGTLYVTLDRQHYESANEPTQWKLSSRNSNIGVTQEIPLQNGFTALYKVEVGIKVDDGESGTATDKNTVTQRNTYIGLKNQYGQIIAGRFDSPLRITEGKVDPFNHLLGDIDSVLGGQSRVSNIVQYSTPTFANTLVHLAFIPGENKDLDGDGENDTRLGDAFSGAAIYSAGNLYAALGVDVNMASGGAALDIGGRSDRVQLVGQYKIDALALGAIVQHARDSDDSKLKDNAVVLNATYQLNAYKLKAQIGANKGKDTEDTRKLYTLGVDYSLSNMAFVTVDYGALDFDPDVGSTTTNDAFTLGYNLKF